MEYKFSIGNLQLKQGLTVIKTITGATDISVDHKITSHIEYGPDGKPTNSVVENEEVTVSCSFIEAGYDTTLTIGANYDLVLSPSGPNGDTGISLTLANCRITGYKQDSKQGEFVKSELTFTKLGALTDAPGSTVTKQVIKFGAGAPTDPSIGDSASIDVGYDGNVNEYIIPTALGLGVRTTTDMGGGKLSIKVNAYVEKNHHLEVEQYLINLFSTLRTTKGTLTITYGSTSYTVTNVAFVRGSMGGGSGKYANFACEFVKSAY